MAGTTPTSAPRSTPGKRRLPPWLVVFIAFDVLLVAGAAWLLLGGSSGSDADDGASSAPTSEASAGATDAAADPAEPDPSPTLEIDPAEATVIASPTGNITCSIVPEGVRCGIASLAAEPAPVAGCEGTVGHVVELTSAGVSTPCVPDAEKPTEAGPDVAVLDYGATSEVNNFVCESTESGMRCTDSTTGDGFVLARAGVSGA